MRTLRSRCMRKKRKKRTILTYTMINSSAHKSDPRGVWGVGKETNLKTDNYQMSEYVHMEERKGKEKKRERQGGA